MNEHGYRDEMPLPTYEEVVGVLNHNIVFKDDVLLRPRPSNTDSQTDSELVRECVGVPTGEDRRRSLGCVVRLRHWTKKYLAALVGIIITPLFFLFIILQLKSCGDCSNMRKEIKSDLLRLEKCKVEMSDILGRYSELYRDLQDTKKEQETLLINKETTETEMKNLRLQYNTATSDVNNLREEATRLKKEIEEYKILLKNQRNDNAVSPMTNIKTTTETTTKMTPKDFLLPETVQKLLQYLYRRHPRPTKSYSLQFGH